MDRKIETDRWTGRQRPTDGQEDRDRELASCLVSTASRDRFLSLIYRASRDRFLSLIYTASRDRFLFILPGRETRDFSCLTPV